LFPGRRAADQSLTTRQYARLVSQWISGVGLDRLKYATHSMRRSTPRSSTGARGTYARCNFWLGYQRIESTVCYLGVEVDEALDIAERIDV
jgi:hypothetical protein